MALFSALILRGVIKRALVLETQSVITYQGLQEKAINGGDRSGMLGENLCRLLAEKKIHRTILLKASEGKLSLEELEALLKEHQITNVSSVEPLNSSILATWEERLSAALEHEERVWIFYSNLRRMSRVPSVKKAFELLAFMEKAHVYILRALLGRQNPGLP